MTTKVSSAMVTYAQTQAEADASITPVNTSYPPGDVRRYGAVLDGEANDTTALQTAANFCAASGVPIQGAAGTALITSTLVLNCTGDLSMLTIDCPSSSVSPAIRVGLTGSDALQLRGRLALPKVNNTTKPGTGWSGQQVGIELAALMEADIYVPYVWGFAVGLDCGGYADGFSYNTVTLGMIGQNKIGIRVGAKTTSGWANQNTFIGGRCFISSGEGTNISGARYIQLTPTSSASTGTDWPNSNTFIGVTLESGQPEYLLEIAGTYNIFQNCRYEASPANVLFTGHASSTYTAHNQIIGGYNAWQLSFTYSGRALYNEVAAAGRASHGGTGVALNLKNHSSSDLPLIQGFDASPVGDAYLGASNTATDWAMRLACGGLWGKAATDTPNERFKLTLPNGQLNWGSGGANPTDTQLYRVTANVLGMAAGDSFKVEGAWNGGTLRLGNNYLWTDANGSVRVKGSAPSSDTDGAPVVTYPRTAEEISAGVTPTDYSYPPGDVRRYGAVGDGEANDTAALSNALLSNDSVTLSNGNFKIVSPLTLRSGHRIVGDDATITFSGSMASTSMILGSSISDVQIRGLKLVGSRTADAVAYNHGYAIGCVSVDDLVVSDCDISGFPNGGIVLTTCDRFRLVNNKIGNILPVAAGYSGAAINICDECLDGLIDGNHISDIGDATRWLLGIRVIVQTGGAEVISKRLRVVNNVLRNIAGHGITFYDGTGGSVSDGSVVANNVIDGTGVAEAPEDRGNGIYCLSVGGLTITGNSISNTNVASASGVILQGGIALASGDQDSELVTVTAMTVTGNTVYNSKFSGIITQGHTNLTIADNVVNGYTESGIRLHGQTQKFAITGNTISGGSGAAEGGITLGISGGGSTRGTITGNFIDANSLGYGILVAGSSDITITGNTISEAATYGLLLQTVDRVLAVGNNINSSTAGCVAYYISNSVCTGSKIEAGAANNRPTYNQPFVRNYAPSGVQVITSGSSVPNQGTWAAGDVCWNTAPSAGGAPGWVCTAAGSPGTWKAMASIAA